MADSDVPTSFVARSKGWVVALTGLLVVLPALINAGADIYSSLLKLPRTEAERINEKLFRDNFGKQPVVSMPVPIKQNNGTVEVRFAVYEKGDVFVEFGNFTQWFPFPSTQSVEKTKVGMSFISSAIAQVSPSPKGVGGYQQSEQIKGVNIVREKIFENGVRETQVIDPRTGDILNSSARQVTQKPAPTRPPSPVNFHKMEPIDLDQIRVANRAKQSGAQSAKASDSLEQDAFKSALESCQENESVLSRSFCEFQQKQRFCGQEDRSEKQSLCGK